MTRPEVTLRVITIDPEANEALVDFPLSVVLAGDRHLAEVAEADGGDIRFTDRDGNDVPFEIVRYEKGNLEAWVRVTIDGRTEIELHYGGEIAERGEPEDTWSERVLATWHLDGETTERDRTRNDNDLSAGVQPVPVPDVGLVGAARRFVDSVDSEKNSQLCGSNAKRFAPAGSFAITMWLAAETPATQYIQPFEAGGYNASVPGFAIELEDTQWYALATSGTHHVVEIAELAPATWTHFAVVVGLEVPALMQTFVDGAEVMSGSAPPAPIVASRRTCLGGTTGYAGLLDEVRLYDGWLSPGWIQAEWANVAERE